MPRVDLRLFAALACGCLLAAGAQAQDETGRSTTADRPGHRESAADAPGRRLPELDTPPLPEGMTLDDVLDRGAGTPPDHFPATVPDDRTYVFTLVEKLAYRVPAGGGRGHLGLEAQGWVGRDYDKFWWKTEGEAALEGTGSGETETDLLYSRLVTPFWNAQVGVQYANEWAGDAYEDRWSGAVALQGLAPYKFELDNALYVSEDGDVTLAVEAEYDLRVTQRLVLQPLFAFGLAAQDVPERGLGAGMTDGTIDARLRYELKREFAPYVGLRYRFEVGQTANITEAAGGDPSRTLLLAGLRFAF